MELVSCERRLQKLINKTTFKHCTRYSDTLNAVSLENKIIKFDKPIYIGKIYFIFFVLYIGYILFLFSIGFAVLDVSKTLMYDYHYNVMQSHYGERIKLMYTDTGKCILKLFSCVFFIN